MISTHRKTATKRARSHSVMFRSQPEAGPASDRVQPVVNSPTHPPSPPAYIKLLAHRLRRPIYINPGRHKCCRLIVCKNVDDDDLRAVCFQFMGMDCRDVDCARIRTAFLLIGILIAVSIGSFLYICTCNTERQTLQTSA